MWQKIPDAAIYNIRSLTVNASKTRECALSPTSGIDGERFSTFRETHGHRRIRDKFLEELEHDEFKNILPKMDDREIEELFHPDAEHYRHHLYVRSCMDWKYLISKLAELLVDPDELLIDSAEPPVDIELIEECVEIAQQWANDADIEEDMYGNRVGEHDPGLHREIWMRLKAWRGRDLRRISL